MVTEGVIRPPADYDENPEEDVVVAAGEHR
jgi:hypothetical protein